MTKESTKKFFKEYFAKKQQQEEKEKQYCYKPYRTLRNYLQWAKHN